MILALIDDVEKNTMEVKMITNLLNPIQYQEVIQKSYLKGIGIFFLLTLMYMLYIVSAFASIPSVFNIFFAIMAGHTYSILDLLQKYFYVIIESLEIFQFIYK